jgi:site-specific recombinase XerD
MDDDGDVAGGRQPMIVGRVERSPDDTLPWVVIDGDCVPVPEVAEYLRHARAMGFAVSSLESYARALLRWLRFLWAHDVQWDRVDRANVRDFVLWMRLAQKGGQRRALVAVAGSVNALTGKRYLDDHYAPATINHNLAVIAEFYDYFLASGRGPLRNPVPPRMGANGERVNAHHKPADPFGSGRRADYRQRVPRELPRAIPDKLFDDLFERMQWNRDRALLAFYVSTGARPTELLDVDQARVKYGDQLIGVVRKGSRELQWLPASPDAFVWLRLYQSQLPNELFGPEKPLWWTLRRPWRRLNYEAARAVLRRANDVLGTNWTLHDLRHTAAMRMADDPDMPLVDIQVLLGHAHLSTTERYLRVRLDQLVRQVGAHHRRRAAAPSEQPVSRIGYDSSDLEELFGRSGWSET